MVIYGCSLKQILNMETMFNAPFDPNQPVDKIVFDGGICAGKTSGMEKTQKQLAERGIIAVVVPEAAAILKGNGLHPKDFSNTDYQRAVLEVQLFNERMFTKMAQELQQKYNSRVVLLCDRGLLSGAAYIDAPNETMLEVFQERILAPYGLSVEEVANSYRAVVHLVTAADGAEEYFTLTNEKARDETPEVARYLDMRSQLSWVGVEERECVPNVVNGKRVTFVTKMQLAAQKALEKLGVPYFIQAERKILLKQFDPACIPVPFWKVEIEQYYIPGQPRVETSIRKRTLLGKSTYHLRKKLPFISGTAERIKVSSLIQKHEYLELLQGAGTALKEVRKSRYCFIIDHTYYKVDVFEKQGRAPILEVYGTPQLPDFFEVVREVTNDPRERNVHYATTVK